MNANAVVLLSGGLDSVAALHWAVAEYGGPSHVRAVTFAYGQPNRDAETTVACAVAAKRGVRCDYLHLCDAVKALDTISAPTPGRTGGVSNANMPGRNGILLSCAAAYAARLSMIPVDIVIGANADDSVAFPDCREAYFRAISVALGLAHGAVGNVDVVTPWSRKTKHEILRWAMNTRASLEDVRASMSCYSGTRCGTCDACTLRAAAFDRLKTADGTAVPKMHGGDPVRDAKLTKDPSP